MAICNNRLRDPKWYLERYLELTGSKLRTGKTYIEVNSVEGRVRTYYSFNRITSHADYTNVDTDVKNEGTD